MVTSLFPMFQGKQYANGPHPRQCGLQRPRPLQNGPGDSGCEGREFENFTIKNVSIEKNRKFLRLNYISLGFEISMYLIVKVFRFDAPLYFANADLFINRVYRACGINPVNGRIFKINFSRLSNDGILFSSSNVSKDEFYII